jgi:M6 family metalloprotease-like protein
MKRLTVSTCLLILLLAGVAPHSFAATKAGGACPKVGSTSIVGSKKFTCIKSGKKLVWNKGTQVAKPIQSQSAQTPEPEKQAPLPTYSALDSFASIETCKLVNENAARSGESLAFPRPSFSIPTVGTHKTLVFFVDFPDVPFQEKQISEWKQNQIPAFQKYLASMSYGKLEYKVDVHESVFHITKSSLSYNLDTAHDAPRKPNADMGGLVRDSIAVADPVIDFSQYEFFNIVMPSTTNIGTEGTTGMDPNQLLDGKSFSRLTIGPIREYVDNPQKKVWFLHEVGHTMGLLHAFNPQNGMPVWGVMSNGTSSEPEFVAWERFILGWIQDSQNRCIDSTKPQKYVLSIAPLSSKSDANKMVTVKLNDHKVIVAEYRTMNPLSRINKAQEGVFIYSVDTNARPNAGAMAALVPGSAKNPLPYGTLQKDEQVSSANVTIKVLGNYADRSDLEIEIK